jgi:cytochrome c oxidase assembly factor CtaG
MKKLHYKLIYISLILMAFLFSGCYVTYTTDPIYEDYTEEVYYHDNSIYVQTSNSLSYSYSCTC